VLPFAGECSGFESAGADVDGGTGDGVEQAVIQEGKPQGGGGGHAMREGDYPSRRVEEADLGGLFSVLTGGGTDHAADELIPEHVCCELLVDVVDGLASEHVGVEDLFELQVADLNPPALMVQFGEGALLEASRVVKRGHEPFGERLAGRWSSVL